MRPLRPVLRTSSPAALDTELHWIRREHNTVRLHASIGYVTPDDEHHGRGPAIGHAQHRRDAPRAGGADQAESSEKVMTTAAIPTTPARPCFSGTQRASARSSPPAGTDAGGTRHG